MARKDLVQKKDGERFVLEWKGKLLAYPPQEQTEAELVETAKTLDARDAKWQKQQKDRDAAIKANSAK